LLYALEVYHDNGSFVKPDEYQKINGVLRWSHTTPTSDFNVTLMGYQGFFNSTDQIPERLVDAGDISRFGYVDPSDGGATHRHSLSTQWQHDDNHGTTKFSAYAYGDRREQLDNRVVTGFNVSRSFQTPATLTTFGGGVRNDNIATVGLFLRNDRVRYPNRTVSDAHVVERDSFAWAQTQARVGPKLRLTGGVRADFVTGSVADFLPANSGNIAQGMVNPKFMAAYAMSPQQELYADFGTSFHSNRRVTGRTTSTTRTRAPTSRPISTARGRRSPNQ
jgi:hypothetical protein